MTRRAQTTLDEPVDVLNYALTLEHLENAFYRDGLEQFDADAFSAAGFAPVVRERLVEIGAHEQEHVDTLSGAIESLDGTSEEEAAYDFGYDDLIGFVGVAQALENTGVGAYQGAAQFLLDEDDLLTVALNIHSVEARHASYINGLLQGSPFPAGTDTPLTPDEVLAIAGPFIVS